MACIPTRTDEVSLACVPSDELLGVLAETVCIRTLACVCHEWRISVTRLMESVYAARLRQEFGVAADLLDKECTAREAYMTLACRTRVIVLVIGTGPIMFGQKQVCFVCEAQRDGSAMTPPSCWSACTGDGDDDGTEDGDDDGAPLAANVNADSAVNAKTRRWVDWRVYEHQRCSRMCIGPVSRASECLCRLGVGTPDWPSYLCPEAFRCFLRQDGVLTIEAGRPSTAETCERIWSTWATRLVCGACTVFMVLR